MKFKEQYNLLVRFFYSEITIINLKSACLNKHVRLRPHLYPYEMRSAATALSENDLGSAAKELQKCWAAVVAKNGCFAQSCEAVQQR